MLTRNTRTRASHIGRLVLLCVAFAATASPATAALKLTPAPGSPFATPRGGGSLAIGDVNHDGIPDIVTVHPSSTFITVLLGTGDGGMTTSTDTFATDGTGNAYDIELADLDGDGDLDVAIASQAARSITVLLGDNTGRFTTAPGSPFALGDPQDSPFRLAAGDIDGDGKTDLVASIVRFGRRDTDPSRPGVVVLRNATTRTGSDPPRVAFAPGPLAAMPQYGGEVKVADVNRDGRLDVVAATTGLAVLLGDGSGGLTPAQGSPFSAGTEGYAYVATGDLNADGNIDAVVSTQSNGVRTFIGGGSGAFTSGAETPAGKGPSGVAIGDLDLDKNADVAVANFAGDPSAGTGTVLLGNGGGGLAPAGGSPFAPGEAFTRAVEIADMNRDGAPDVVLGREAKSVTVLLNASQPLSVGLEAFAPSGEKLEGQVASGDVVLVRLTVTNTGNSDLHGLQPAGGAPVLVDPKGTGGLTLLSGPTPAFDASTLPAHSSRQYVYALTASGAGRAAVESKITDEDPALGHLESGRSLRFDVADKDAAAQPFDKALTGFLAVNVVDRALVKSFRSYHDQISDQAEKLAGVLRRELSAAERKKWFGGNGSKLLIGNEDFARARQEASSGATMATQFPKATFHGHTPAELMYEYDKAFAQEVGKGVSKYVKGYADLGLAAKRGLEREWSEAVLSARYFWGTATPEERQQVIATATDRAASMSANAKSLFTTAVREIPRTIDNIGYLMEAADKSYEQAFTYPVELAHGLYKRQVALAPLLDSDPVKYQQESAKLSAGVVNAVLPVVLDTLIAKGATKLYSAGKAYLIAGEGAAVIETAEAAGTLTESGKATEGATSVLLDDSQLPHGLSAEEVAALEREGIFLKRNPHATVIQSTDAGKVYELPNLGGVPETTLEAKAEILKALEDEYFARTGKRIKLAEVLKPGTPLAKADGVAKTELTEPKTGKPEMIDGGMPDEGLGEANVWRNKLSPEKSNPDFANWSRPRQDAARKAWRQANVTYQEYLNPTDPTSKIARLKQCIGKLGRVPLDLQPIGNGPEKGLQRFVEAEFEEISYKQGTADVKLLRVKRYAVEVVDTNTGKVVNRRVVVDSKVALPQTPDADAVAVAKVVGTDATGNAILAPLAREEREFLMQRYVDKNVKARASGRVPDLAEHGTTLVMDDASAKAAGKLLPAYGVPFLGKRVGTDYLARIAKFVAPKGVSADAMLTKMLKAVQASGGFGQHTVVVTADSRFFGEVPFASW